MATKKRATKKIATNPAHSGSMQKDYDIALSFAGEDREVVDVVAALLKERSVRVFYDKYEQAQLWGKDLYQHLSYVYKDAARFCVIFIFEELC